MSCACHALTWEGQSFCLSIHQRGQGLTFPLSSGNAGTIGGSQPVWTQAPPWGKHGSGVATLVPFPGRKTGKNWGEGKNEDILGISPGHPFAQSPEPAQPRRARRRCWGHAVGCWGAHIAHRGQHRAALQRLKSQNTYFYHSHQVRPGHACWN